MKHWLLRIVLVSSLALASAPALAHVVVKPDQIGIGAFQTFTTGVPNEKDQPVVGLRLVIPDGLKSVSPNVKPGWKVDIKKNGAGDTAPVTEINWTGGQIPAGQRDDFMFSAQAPDKTTTLAWKAYQTYQDGTVVSWDQTPVAGRADDDTLTPYSQTKVVNDLASTDSLVSSNQIPLYLSILAIFVSALAWFRRR